ncbi:uncharacterized protein At4g22758-like [Cornus florida]|uniref:uncharacterized protein At4g22758-like n=1 Tax=Cornus florida TaxID=4283 RepID=UPI0028A0993F|nr:uncharacterized protein At4g22758-like [Cornus florida]
MSERNFRSTLPAKNRRSRPPHPSPSTHRPARRSSKQSKAVKIIRRFDSEPNLWTVGLVGAGDEHRNLTAPDALFCRGESSMYIFSSPELLPQSPQNMEGYNKEAKVVVNVAVEGSTGPIRIMVKLGSNVEDTIKLVVKKYSEEGRSPQLGKDAASTFELHHSYFSLQSLKKSDVIGDVGSRSFYLRKNNGDHSRGGEIASASFISERSTVSVRSSPPTPFFFLPAFVARKISKIIRRTHKLWKILGCMHCNG